VHVDRDEVGDVHGGLPAAFAAIKFRIESNGTGGAHAGGTGAVPAIIPDDWAAAMRVIPMPCAASLVSTLNYRLRGPMTPSFIPASGVLAALDLLRIEIAGPIAHLRLMRPDKRNAINDTLVTQLHTAFLHWPAEVRAVVLSGEGQHFCAGLDLSEMSERSTFEGVAHSRMWHATMDAIQFGRVPVIAVLHGAVVGGGLELASACHLRVAEASTFYGLPEGQRGLFARMTDMMLTGRVLDADEGQAVGLSHYRVGDGEGLAKAVALAQKVASNSPLSNFAVMQALPRIADLSQSDGLFVESLMAAIAQGDASAKQRMRDFLEGRAGKVTKS
jgi:enoyl-CoA hydratase/carnithine racemase